MDFANWLVSMYNSESFIQLAFASAVFAAIVGHFVHRFMGEASFGTVANAGIILVAIATSSSIDDYRIATLLPDNALRISTVAVVIAAGILIMIASFKHWLRDHIN